MPAMPPPTMNPAQMYEEREARNSANWDHANNVNVAERRETRDSSSLSNWDWDL